MNSNYQQLKDDLFSPTYFSVEQLQRKRTRLKMGKWTLSVCTTLLGLSGLTATGFVTYLAIYCYLQGKICETDNICLLEWTLAETASIFGTFATAGLTLFAANIAINKQVQLNNKIIEIDSVIAEKQTRQSPV